MTFSEAKEKAQEAVSEMGLNIGSALDDGKYYIFGYEEEADIPPVGIDKATGEVIFYHPPDHLDDYLNAKEVE